MSSEREGVGDEEGGTSGEVRAGALKAQRRGGSRGGLLGLQPPHNHSAATVTSNGCNNARATRATALLHLLYHRYYMGWGIYIVSMVTLVVCMHLCSRNANVKYNAYLNCGYFCKAAYML